MRTHSIFDLIGLAHRVSQHPEHTCTVSYCGGADWWEVYIHKRSDLSIAYSCKVLDTPLFDNDRTIEQAYIELKEYLP